MLFSSRKTRYAAVVAGAVTLIAVGAGGAVAGAKITGADIARGTITGSNIHAATITKSKLTPGAVASLKGATGARGPAGKAGKDAIVTVTALTSLNDRPDSGDFGDWANDDFTRTATVTREAGVPVSDCGTSSTVCYFFTGTVSDAGVFTTIAGANTPAANEVDNGVNRGDMNGSDHFEFYADAMPNPELVPTSLDGAPTDSETTSNWLGQFFPNGTYFNVTNQFAWSWTYTVPLTCETWVDAASGETGNITGVNHCSS